jgi:hypothetical protein
VLNLLNPAVVLAALSLVGRPAPPVPSTFLDLAALDDATAGRCSASCMAGGRSWG